MIIWRIVHRLYRQISKKSLDRPIDDQVSTNNSEIVNDESLDHSHDQIDVNELMNRLTEEELLQTAEEYFRANRRAPYLLKKPFGSLDETPVLLTHFSGALFLLELFPQCTVLDFGAGTGWTSRMIAQMGCKVISADVSKSALEISKDSADLSGQFVRDSELSYLHFDGKRIDLLDDAVDRILVMDAFHHVVNQQEVLVEFERVLRPGGILVFCEPGPLHSLTPQSQAEMRNYKVVERNFSTTEMSKMAKIANLTDGEMGLYSPAPTIVPTEVGEEFLRADISPLAEGFRTWHSNHRLLRFRKPGRESKDSRHRAGLAGRIEYSDTKGDFITLSVTNSGSSDWLPSGGSIGAVNLGCHVVDTEGSTIQFSARRFHISDQNVSIGQTVEIKIPRGELPNGLIRFDLVAEEIAWFSWDGHEFPTFKN